MPPGVAWITKALGPYAEAAPSLREPRAASNQLLQGSLASPPRGSLFTFSFTCMSKYSLPLQDRLHQEQRDHPRMSQAPHKGVRDTAQDTWESLKQQAHEALDRMEHEVSSAPRVLGGRSGARAAWPSPRHTLMSALAASYEALPPGQNKTRVWPGLTSARGWLAAALQPGIHFLYQAAQHGGVHPSF